MSDPQLQENVNSTSGARRPEKQSKFPGLRNGRRMETIWQ